jgi:hypothetical protein
MGYIEFENPGVSEKKDNKYLSRERADQWMELYANIASQAVEIGDSDLRRTTFLDRVAISQVREEVEIGDSEVIKEGLDKLGTIIGGGGEHSLLAKILATIAYCDIAVQMEEPPDSFVPLLSEAMTTEPESGGDVVLAGALYARLAYHYTPRENGQQIMEQLDEALVGAVETEEQAIMKAGIHAASRVICEMIAEDSLKMRLPVAVISSGVETEISESLGGGYPDKVMYLGVGYLPSLEKLKEAALYGMPDASKHILTRRIQRVLAGVELEDPAGESRSIGRIVTVPRRRMVHIYLRALRKPELPADEVFADESSLTRERVINYGSFDSLSYFVAVRTARELRSPAEAKKLDAVPLRTDAQKRRSVERIVNRWVRKLAEPVGRLPDGSKPSVLSVALEESQRFHGIENWGMKESKEHIRYSARALVLRKVMGELRIREEDEITDLYRSRVWDEELSEDDLVELGLSLLQNPKSRFWKEMEDVPNDLQNEIARAAIEGKDLGNLARGHVLQAILNKKDDVFVLRCETIRDVLEPRGLSEKIAED